MQTVQTLTVYFFSSFLFLYLLLTHIFWVLSYKLVFNYVLECSLFMSGTEQASLVCVDSIDEYVIDLVRETPF